MFRWYELARLMGGIMVAWGLVQTATLYSYRAQAAEASAPPFAVVELFTSEG